jgi:hypothetical protein
MSEDERGRRAEERAERLAIAGIERRENLKAAK